MQFMHIGINVKSNFGIIPIRFLCETDVLGSEMDSIQKGKTYSI